ncbi:hypothetical protein HID58_018110 [Brassica napus]|uniref:Uncharacterized protein n=1 Tax=Brassica napus TaxID=3708 RepID=A0ABQ8D905_BRANA|nr:hypothetical protein HID58_018110 [Brassica napus]
MALACESHHRCSAILGDGQRVWFVSTCNRSITGCSFSLQDEESSIVFRGGSRGVLQRFVGHRSSDLTFCDGVLESSIPVSWWCRLVWSTLFLLRNGELQLMWWIRLWKRVGCLGSLTGLTATER